MDWIKNCKCGSPDLALLIARLVLALVFMMHGWQKLQGIDGVAGFFGNLGIPLPGIMAWVVACVEFFGGLAMLLGVWTHWAGKLLAAVMVVAIITVKSKVGVIAPMGGGPGAELDLALLALALVVSMIGPGKYTVKMLMGGSKPAGQSMM